MDREDGSQHNRLRPFLRWAGSKQKLLKDILPLVPAKFGRYYEPFLGSGALFFALRPKRATVSDVSSEVIGTWKAVRDDCDYICSYLAPLKPSKDLFYEIRSDRASAYPARAAEFLYLNKTCWNGLYRVNSRGEFNVPYGAPKTDHIFDEDNVRRCSNFLNGSGITIRKCDFEASVSRAKFGDLVFFDPPYVTKHNFNGFRDYNENLFSWGDQVRLSKLAAKLVEKGVHVIVSNADHDSVRELYKEFGYYSLQRTSTLASDTTKRGRVSEAIFFA